MQRLHVEVRPGRSEPGPLLVLLHGLGSNEMDLLAFQPYLDPRITVASFRAPHDYMDGFAWFGMQWTAEGRIVDQDQAVESRNLLAVEIEQLASQTSATQTIVGGFSQGAMMTLGLLLSRPEILSGALLMSGRSLPAFEAGPAPAAAGVPVLMQHGTFDEVIPIDEGQAACDYLQSRGVAVEFRPYPMGHQVSDRSLRDLIDWLNKTLAL